MSSRQDKLHAPHPISLTQSSGNRRERPQPISNRNEFVQRASVASTPAHLNTLSTTCGNCHQDLHRCMCPGRGGPVPRTHQSTRQATRTTPSYPYTPESFASPSAGVSGFTDRNTSLQQHNSAYVAHVRELYTNIGETPPAELVPGVVTLIGADGRPYNVEVPLGVRTPDFLRSEPAAPPSAAPPLPPSVNTPPSVRRSARISEKNGKSPVSNTLERHAKPSTSSPRQRRKP